MQRARLTRGTLAVLLTTWLGLAGCTHNYYYGALPVACAPGTIPACTRRRRTDFQAGGKPGPDSLFRTVLVANLTTRVSTIRISRTSWLTR